MTPPLNLGTFRELLDTYGSDLSRWPVGESRQAKQLLKTDIDARALYQQEQKIDAALKNAEETDPPADLLNKIMKNIK